MRHHQHGLAGEPVEHLIERGLHSAGELSQRLGARRAVIHGILVKACDLPRIQPVQFIAGFAFPVTEPDFPEARLQLLG